MSSGPNQRPSASPPTDVPPRAKVTRRQGKRSLPESVVSRDNADDTVLISDSQPLFAMNVSSPQSVPSRSKVAWGAAVRPSPCYDHNVCADDQPSCSVGHSARGFVPVALADTNVVSAVSAPLVFTSAAPPLPSSATLASAGLVRQRPPSPLYSASNQSEVSDLASHLDARDDADYQASLDAEGPSGRSSFSLKESLLRLLEVCPNLAAPSSVQSSASSSVTESILGISPSEGSQSLALVESALVSAAVKEAVGFARHSAVVPSHDSLSDFPHALPCGKFLRPRSFDLMSGVGIDSLVASSVVPESSLPLSHEDLLLAASAPAKAVSIPERAVVDMEETARRALVSCTLADSFLGGLLTSVGVPGSQPFQLHRDIDPQDVVDFGLSVSRILRFTASSVARLHVNLVLARRDALLSASSSVRDSRTRTALRHTPFSSSSLFAGQVQPVVRRLAEASRDLASVAPAVSAPSQPSASSQPGFSGPSSYQPAPFRPRARPYRAPSGRAPYTRRPPLPSQAPARGSARR